MKRTKFKFEMKWTNSLKDTICQKSPKKKIDSLNSFLSNKEIEIVTTFQNRKLQAQMGSLVNSTKPLRKNYTNSL